MEKILATVPVKAPYFKVGQIDDQTKEIWIIFHGYGQLADEFADSFGSFKNLNRVLIFPQGLSKFYLKGVGKKIGASWMTAYDRNLDIDNYILFLNQIYDHEVKPYHKNIEVNILGFSQGGHTASRWIYKSSISYCKMILWGSSIAQEIDQNEVVNSFSNGKNLMVLGDQDRFINEIQYGKLKLRYEKIGFNYQLIRYLGGHTIDPKILDTLI